MSRILIPHIKCLHTLFEKINTIISVFKAFNVKNELASCLLTYLPKLNWQQQYLQGITFTYDASLFCFNDMQYRNQFNRGMLKGME